MRRFLGAGLAGALLVTGGALGAGTAVAAEDPTIEFGPVESGALMPGEGWFDLRPSGPMWNGTGEMRGTFVYAMSKKPLKDATWAGGGLPTGLKVNRSEGCTPKAGKPGVYTCPASAGSHPWIEVSATSTAANGLAAYYGFVYVPPGSSVDAGIKDAQTAATKPFSPRRSHATVTAWTKAHVARNTMTLTTPAVPAGGTAKHTVKLHAVTPGRLSMYLNPAPGFRPWDEGELKVTADGISAGGATGATCDHSTDDSPHLRCTVTRTGDYTITYGLKAASDAPAWRLRNNATYEVYSFGTGNPEKYADFSVSSPVPVIQRHTLVGRGTDGDLYSYDGTGKRSPLFREYFPVGYSGDWNRYSAITRLGPLTVQGTGPGAVARDKSGVLWFLRPSADGSLFLDRLRVGGGWNDFPLLAGASDLTGDKKADLLARGKDGVLWLHPGTGVPTTPFGGRVRVGGGWSGYDILAGGTDVTGDGKADLVGRDTAGKLWLHQGTGSAAKPFGDRKQIGYGFQTYNAMVATGDLNSDGKADLVARDTTGTLWYYAGTGSATDPYAKRAAVGGGWQRYNLLF